jgi:hypothetical protein
MKFYAFRKRDGSIHVKGYHEIVDGGIDPELEKIYDNIFIDEVLDPFEAMDLKEAEHKAKDKLKVNVIYPYHNKNIRNMIVD